jgi:tetratricopeptide (TPR) repeat protein
MRVAILHRVFNQPSLSAKKRAGSRHRSEATAQSWRGLLAKGFYHYACLKDYDTAVEYLEQAHHAFCPIAAGFFKALAYVERRRGNWDKSEAYFNEAEKLDPRNVNLLSQHARSYVCLRRFPKHWQSLSRFSISLPTT